MDTYQYHFNVAADDSAFAGRSAQALADSITEINGVLEVGRHKVNEGTMDLGTVVIAVATSSATLAVARGVAAWLQARRGASITIERDGASGSIKAEVSGIDPELAVRIAEIVRQ